MNARLKLAIVGFAAGASVLMAQETPATSSTSSQTTSTTTQTSTITGEVVQFQPGQTIVVRDAEGKTQTYTLDPSLTVPSDVQVGRRIMLYSSPVDGSLRVQKITMVESTGPDGSKQTHTEMKDEPGTPPASSMDTKRQTTTTNQSSSSSSYSSQQPPAEGSAQTQTQTTKTTKTTTVSGTVKAYEPGQSITVVGPGNKVTTYTITTDSQLPQDVAVGKTVTMQTTVVSGKPVVRSVTSKTTTTKTTKTKTLSPQ